MMASDTITSFGFTFGASHTQSSWGDARHVSWPDMVEVLTSHVPGAKEGSCLVPAIFTGSSRKKEEAAQIDVAFLDSDSGATLDDIVAALKERRWEAVVSSTHSHMTTSTIVSATNWDRYFAKHPGITAEEFLIDEKGYLPAVAYGASVVKTDATHVHIEHAPCPKFRVAVPLFKPWRASDYPSQTVANSAWKACIEALASALDLPHDQACTDTSRLFYLPRRPLNGAIPETAVVSGEYCDIFSLQKPTAPDLLAHAASAKINGHAPSIERHEHADPITGEIIDLTTWARLHGRGFLIAKMLQARRPSAITGLIVDNTKVHIRCPNEGAHTHPGQDNATFVVNAGVGATEGFVIHCRHAHCTGQDRLFFLGRMLSERWIEIDDLTAGEFQINVPADHLITSDDAIPPEEVDPNYLAAISADMNRSPVDAVMTDFNRKYMVINEAGRAVIYAPAYDPVLKRERFDRMTFEDLKRLYLNRRVKVGEDEKSKSVMRGVADLWLTHPDRRQYINGVTFDPSSREQQDGVLNLWKGFATKPKAGDWSLMRAHIRDVLCNRDHERFSYLMGWMARMLQQPDAQGEVAVVLKGGEGAGKGTLAKALLSIIGYHSLAISNSKHLTGNFNAHLRDVVFLFADEAFFAGDKASIGSLKSLITEPYLTVEAKYQNAVQIPNFLHIIMASNEEWVVPASLDARRFFVLDVPDDRKGQHAYFAKIIAQMEAGGFQAMLHDLLAFDLTDFNIRDVPITEGLQQQKKLSLGTADSWWMEVLHRGYVLQSRHGQHEYFGEWQDLVSTEVLYASYMQWADRRRERHPMSREMLGRQMRMFGCRPRRLLNAVVGEETRDVENGYGTTSKRGALIRRHQPPGYSIGNLELARNAFTNQTQLHVDWEDTIDDDEQP